MVLQFLNEQCLLTGTTPKYELFKQYRLWWAKKGIQVEFTAFSVFARDLYAASAGRIRPGKRGNVRVFVGVCINPV